MTTITQDYFLRNSLSSLTRSAIADPYARSLKRSTSRPASTVQSKAYPDLARIAQECSEDGWDGYSAKPVEQSTCDRAFEFLNSLPAWMVAPDIIPESDGDIAIEWYVAPRLTFSISIGAEGPLHYAGLFGNEEEAHGVVPFSDHIPETILRHISEILRAADASLAA